MSDEARIAANWWADHLGIKSDTGVALNDYVLESARGTVPVITPEQREAFRVALAAAIDEQIVGNGLWQEAVRRGDPHWGIAANAISVDYGPDRIIAGALEIAGIQTGLLAPVPTKTVMHIGPGLVRVAAGYGTPWKDVGEEGKDSE